MSAITTVLAELGASIKLLREGAKKRSVAYAKETAKQIKSVAKGLLQLADSVAGYTVTVFASYNPAADVVVTYPTGTRDSLTTWTKTVEVPTGDLYRLVIDGGYFQVGTLNVYVDGVVKFTYVNEGIYCPFEAIDLTAGSRVISITYQQDLVETLPVLTDAKFEIQKVVS